MPTQKVFMFADLLTWQKHLTFLVKSQNMCLMPWLRDSNLVSLFFNSEPKLASISKINFFLAFKFFLTFCAAHNQT